MSALFPDYRPTWETDDHRLLREHARAFVAIQAEGGQAGVPELDHEVASPRTPGARAVHAFRDRPAEREAGHGGAGLRPVARRGATGAGRDGGRCGRGGNHRGFL